MDSLTVVAQLATSVLNFAKQLTQPPHPFPQWLRSPYHTHPSINRLSSDLRTRVFPISHLPALLISPISSNMPKTTLGSRMQPTMLMDCVTNILVLMSLIRLTYRSLLALTLACHMVMPSVFRQLPHHGGRVVQSKCKRIMKMVLHLFPFSCHPISSSSYNLYPSQIPWWWGNIIFVTIWSYSYYRQIHWTAFFLFSPFPSISCCIIYNPILSTCSLYDIYLQATTTTATSTRGVQIPISLSSSTTDPFSSVARST